MAYAVSSIPESLLDLASCPPVAALSTIGPDGYPQTSVVWCDFDGADIRVSTMRGFAKERNMRRDPRVAVLCFDPMDPRRALAIEGVVVVMTEDGAPAHLDALASAYAGRPIRYFGGSVAAELEASEVPILCRIHPTSVVAIGDTDADGETP